MERARRVLEVLQANPDGLTTPEIAALADPNSTSKNAVQLCYFTLRRHEERGRVRRDGNARAAGAPVHWKLAARFSHARRTPALAPEPAAPWAETASAGE